MQKIKEITRIINYQLWPDREFFKLRKFFIPRLPGEMRKFLNRASKARLLQSITYSTNVTSS